MQKLQTYARIEVGKASFAIQKKLELFPDECFTLNDISESYHVRFIYVPIDDSNKLNWKEVNRLIVEDNTANIEIEDTDNIALKGILTIDGVFGYEQRGFSTVQVIASFAEKIFHEQANGYYRIKIIKDHLKMKSRKIELISYLRKKTLASFSICKEAITESLEKLGDHATEDEIKEEATKLLVQKNAIIASKKANNTLTNGILIQDIDHTHGFGISLFVGCEQEPTANNTLFLEVAHKIADIALTQRGKSTNEILNFDYNETLTVAEKLFELTSTLSENIQIGNYTYLEIPDNSAEYKIIMYNHGNTLCGSIGIFNKDADINVCNALLMQILVGNPLVIDREELLASVVKCVKNVGIKKIKQQLAEKNVNITNAILDSISKSTLNTFCINSVLSEQPITNTEVYGKGTVKNILNKYNIQILDFERFSL